MKTTNQLFFTLFLLVATSCSKSAPQIAKDLLAANGNSGNDRIINHIATNEHDRNVLFTYVNSDPKRITTIKTKQNDFYSSLQSVLSVIPSQLELDSQCTSQETLNFYEYSFSSPWPDCVETDKHEGLWTLFQDQSGRSIMFSKAVSTNTFDNFVLQEMPSYTNDYTWIRYFGVSNHSVDNEYLFYQQILETTPEGRANCNTIEEVYRYLALALLKSILLSGKESPVIYELQANSFRGYQIGDTNKPGRYDIRLFNDNNEPIQITFGFKKDHESTITQQDVNCVLMSLK